LAEIWQCADCPTIIHRHPDPTHESQAWTEQFIAEHEAVHAEQLAEHNGDRDALRMRLNHPALHATLTQLGRLNSETEVS
jgi:hypothetical protein